MNFCHIHVLGGGGGGKSGRVGGNINMTVLTSKVCASCQSVEYYLLREGCEAG